MSLVGGRLTDGVAGPLMFGPECRGIAASIRTSVKVMIASVL